VYGEAVNALVVFAALLYIACLHLADEKGWLWLHPNVERKSITCTGLTRWEGTIVIVHKARPWRTFITRDGDLVEALS
jgi:hypothetical protein